MSVLPPDVAAWRSRRPRAIAIPLSRSVQPLRRLTLLTGLVLLVLVALLGAVRAAPAPDSFADLAEKLLPAVVNISTTQVVRSKDNTPEMPQFPPGSPFEEFFNRRGQGGGKRGDAPQKATALGSGFLIDPSGLVVTNNHVVADADEITVILHDERSYSAKLLGRDSKADLALLKLEKAPNNLPFVPFGNSDEMRVGDWVVAIGNPFGLGGSVTAGIISARARNIQAGPYDDFLQTDAAINKGNSGGPLFNIKGQVIGINTAIFSPSGGSIGIGFSIPANLAQPIIGDLQKFGKTRRGWLGVQIQSIDGDIADNLGLKDKHGALVAKVTPASPAAKAGLKTSDVIVSFDGKEVTDPRRLSRMVAETPIGRTVQVGVIRAKKQQSLPLQVGEMPEDPKDVADAKPEDKPAKAKEPAAVTVGPLGLTLAPLTAATRQRFDLPDDVSGVVVTETRGSAAEAGLEAGMLVVEIQQTAISTPEEVKALVDQAVKAGRKSILLLVQDGSGVRYITLPLGKK